MDDPILRVSAEEESGTFLRIIRILCLLIKFKRRRLYLNRSNCFLTGSGKRGSSFCAALSSSE